MLRIPSFVPQQGQGTSPLDAAVASEPLDVQQLVVNLLIGAALALVLGWHFRRFGATLANRREFTNVLPFVMLTTILIISVVKSSLALSLGLVGALSIVRFRTPIKEPEELAYLFVALAIGVGLGAGQRWPTIVAALVILAVMAAVKWSRARAAEKGIYLSIELPHERAEQCLEPLHEILGHHVRALDLRRFDLREQVLSATWFLDVASSAALAGIGEELRGRFPTIAVTFLDQSRVQSV